MLGKEEKVELSNESKEEASKISDITRSLRGIILLPDVSLEQIKEERLLKYTEND